MSKMGKIFPTLAIVTWLRIAYNGYVRKRGITMKVTATYNFFRKGNGFEMVQDDKLYSFTAEMVTCLIAQYRLMGYIIDKTDLWISVTKIEKKG